MNELSACAHALLDGVPNKVKQKEADQWIYEFKNTNAAWSICIEAIRDYSNDTTLVFVAIQILRQKVEKEWFYLTIEEQNYFEMTFMEFLECTATKNSATVPAFVRRVACDNLALTAVRRPESWNSIFLRFYSIASGERGQEYCYEGFITLLEILGAIPSKLILSEAFDKNEVFERALNVYICEKENVRLIALSSMRSFPNLNSTALQCIENWVVGSIPGRPTFGLDITDICSNGDLLEKLFDVMMGFSELDTLLVTSIMTDILSAGPREISAQESNHHHNMHHRMINQMTLMLLHMLERLQTEASARNNVYRGIAQILSILATQYLSVICQEEVAIKHQQLTRKLMQALLILTAFPDVETAQLILEFWYFFLDDTSSSPWKLLSHSCDEPEILDFLNSAVRALLSQCHLPDHIILAENYGTNETNPEIAAFRSEIADTLLSMFKRWPSPNGAECCFNQLAAMMEDGTNITIIESILYVLDRLLELFDVISSNGIDPNRSSDHGCIHVSEKVLLQCLQLPDHSVVFFSIARYLKSLVHLQALSHATKKAAIGFLLQGLTFPSRIEVITPLLLELISKTSTTLSLQERHAAAQTLSQHCHLRLHLDCHLDQVGDLLATLYQLIGMQDTQESCNISHQLLLSMKHRLCSESDIAAKSLYLMGRLVAGIVNPARKINVLVYTWHESCQALLQCRNHPSLHHYIFPFVNSCLFLMIGNDFERLEHILNLCLTEYSICFHQVILCLTTMYSMLPPNADNFKNLADSAFSRCSNIMLSKVGYHSSNSENKNIEHLMQLSNGASTAVIVESELPEYFKLAHIALVLPADRSNLNNLFEQSARLGCVVLAYDHKIRSLNESACRFIVEIIVQQFGSSPKSITKKNIQVASAIMPEFLCNLLTFLDPRRTGYTKKSIWDYLYTLRFSPNVSPALQYHVAETCLLLLSKQLDNKKLMFLSDEGQMILLQILSPSGQRKQPSRMQFRQQFGAAQQELLRSNRT